MDPGAAELDSSTECMTDADEDGYGPFEDGGTDCDDSDSTMNANDMDGDGLSTCAGDCDDSDVNDSADMDGDGVTICEGDLFDDNPAIAYVSPSGPTFANIVVDASFSMGSPVVEPGRDGDETIHSVYLTHNFLIMNTEVTQGQYAQYTGSNPAANSECGLECPIESVSWHDAAVYANLLSVEDGLTPCYDCDAGECIMNDLPYNCDGYRLPTEAEWEYAARGGSVHSFWTPSGGTDLPESAILHSLCDELVLANGENLHDIAWYCGNSFPETHEVSLQIPNGYGLYDMHGNVEEWTEDFYASYPTGTVYDPYTATGEVKVLRGGSYESAPQDLRSANRRSVSSLAKRENLGFRLVRSSPFE